SRGPRGSQDSQSRNECKAGTDASLEFTPQPTGSYANGKTPSELAAETAALRRQSENCGWRFAGWRLAKTGSA
ncbi:MAG: hypothetical protein L0Z50_15355, partial [Verrucomicrobiales bacterium]|nr:hypothetical protein [Verrucomicrobiales bacterium]